MHAQIQKEMINLEQLRENSWEYGSRRTWKDLPAIGIAKEQNDDVSVTIERKSFHTYHIVVHTSELDFSQLISYNNRTCLTFVGGWGDVNQIQRL